MQAPYLGYSNKQQNIRRVFISFHMKDIFAKTLLIEQAKSDKFELKFTNYAVNKPFDSKWKTNCKERIKQTSVVVCLIGEHTWQREAVICELETANSLGKSLLGIKIHRNRYLNIPAPLITYGAPVINWNINDIIYHLNTL